MLAHPSRRRFLKKATFAVAGGTLLAACASRSNSKWRFFTDEEAQLVDLLTEQIIPTDDSPGAIQAGCLNFIDKQLMGPYERYQTDYRQGLLSLEKTCRQLHGKSFKYLAWEQQTEILMILESGRVDAALWPSVSPQHFFALINAHTLQGFYGSPRHGGNRNFISYKMLDLDIPHIIGQNRYTQGRDRPNGWIAE